MPEVAMTVRQFVDFTIFIQMQITEKEKELSELKETLEMAIKSFEEKESDTSFDNSHVFKTFDWKQRFIQTIHLIFKEDNKFLVIGEILNRFYAECKDSHEIMSLPKSTVYSRVYSIMQQSVLKNDSVFEKRIQNGRNEFKLKQ